MTSYDDEIHARAGRLYSLLNPQSDSSKDQDFHRWHAAVEESMGDAIEATLLDVADDRRLKKDVLLSELRLKHEHEALKRHANRWQAMAQHRTDELNQLSRPNETPALPVESQSTPAWIWYCVLMMTIINLTVLFAHF